MYHIEFVAPLSWEIRHVTQDYFEALNEICPVTTPLPVYVLPLKYLVYEDPKCLGRFEWDYISCHIELAGKQTDIEGYKDTICHEFAHYLQWTGDVEVQERGVKVRARNLMKKVENQLSLSLSV